MNKELFIKVGKWSNSILWGTVKKTSKQSTHFSHHCTSCRLTKQLCTLCIFSKIYHKKNISHGSIFMLLGSRLEDKGFLNFPCAFPNVWNFATFTKHLLGIVLLPSSAFWGSDMNVQLYLNVLPLFKYKAFLLMTKVFCVCSLWYL